MARNTSQKRAPLVRGAWECGLACASRISTSASDLAVGIYPAVDIWLDMDMGGRGGVEQMQDTTTVGKK